MRPLHAATRYALALLVGFVLAYGGVTLYTELAMKHPRLTAFVCFIAILAFALYDSTKGSVRS